jgi:hypothetical protein
VAQASQGRELRPAHGRIFGWDGLRQQISPWTDKDEAQIGRWLGETN